MGSDDPGLGVKSLSRKRPSLGLQVVLSFHLSESLDPGPEIWYLKYMVGGPDLCHHKCPFKPNIPD